MQPNKSENIFKILFSEMPQTIEEFVKIATKIIKHKFTGEPQHIQRCIEEITLLESIAENAETKRICFIFIKSRLDDRLRKTVENKCDSIETLIHILKQQSNIN